MKNNILISIVVLLTAILIAIFLKDETLQILGKGAVMGSIAYLPLKTFKIKCIGEK